MCTLRLNLIFNTNKISIKLSAQNRLAAAAGIQIFHPRILRPLIPFVGFCVPESLEFPKRIPHRAPGEIFKNPGDVLRATIKEFWFHRMNFKRGQAG